MFANFGWEVESERETEVSGGWNVHDVRFMGHGDAEKKENRDREQQSHRTVLTALQKLLKDCPKSFD